MTRKFTFSFTTKSQAMSAFDEICPEVMADGTYEYTHLYQGGSVVQTITVKNGEIV